jgi:hypothetical protein
MLYLTDIVWDDLGYLVQGEIKVLMATGHLIAE